MKNLLRCVYLFFFQHLRKKFSFLFNTKKCRSVHYTNFIQKKNLTDVKKKLGHPLFT